VSASWVLYKLDLGINHVLIDEAQDTSPKQWEIIRHLVSEFTAGEGARGSLKRSIFAVGDEKQSIFSFQGASPRHFADMGRYFRRAHADIGRPFREVRFNHSFRSAPAVLEAVDTVFGRQEAYDGLTADPVRTVHQAVREHAPGMVEIWELIRPNPREETEGWDAPFDTVSETSPPVRLARKIARAVRHALASGIRPGDILVLVRQRGALFEAIIRALKDADVEVAGADRLMLTEHIAVMDLMVLADYLLLPADDLALATVLRSPLFGLDEEQLFELAWQRTGTLHEALEAKARSDARYAAAREALHRMAAAAQQQTPFAFFARVLGAERGRARMLARFGPEAADALDEFLNLALAYESSETPSLQGFIAWLRAAPTEIKRDMEIARDEVRVMTVHGAKGLEAPVVILADTTTSPRGPRDPRLLTLARPGAGDALVWAAARTTDVEAMALARAESRRAAENEYRRLLYVAMTRAADRLIVCGAEGVQKRPKGCWYDLVFDALVGDRPGEEAPDGIGRIWHFRKGEDAAVAPAPRSAETAARVDLPEWLQNDAAAEPAATIRISPARALDATLSANASAPAAATGAVRERAQARGILLHRLIQSLPELPPEQRAEAASRYLARAGGDFAAEERNRFVAEILAVLDHPGFRPLAAADSRAEVPIVGRLSRPGGTPIAVSGQLDRLAVTADTVWIADYKTNRPAPRRLDEVPAAYVAQLALYRALIAKLYPGRTVRTVLVWTDVPDFMEIPASLLDQALAAITAA
jgi:ATP-dependent helicase/nuclease subunit A